MIMSMQNCSPGAQKQVGSIQWKGLDSTTISLQNSQVSIQEKNPYYHLRQMFFLKVTLAFFREERALKIPISWLSVHFASLIIALLFPTQS